MLRLVAGLASEAVAAAVVAQAGLEAVESEAVKGLAALAMTERIAAGAARLGAAPSAVVVRLAAAVQNLAV